jgi:hypothetical protein
MILVIVLYYILLTIQQVLVRMPSLDLRVPCPVSDRWPLAFKSSRSQLPYRVYRVVLRGKSSKLEPVGTRRGTAGGTLIHLQSIGTLD